MFDDNQDLVVVVKDDIFSISTRYLYTLTTVICVLLAIHSNTREKDSDGMAVIYLSEIYLLCKFYVCVFCAGIPFSLTFTHSQ